MYLLKGHVLIPTKSIIVSLEIRSKGEASPPPQRVEWKLPEEKGSQLCPVGTLGSTPAPHPQWGGGLAGGRRGVFCCESRPGGGAQTKAFAFRPLSLHPLPPHLRPTGTDHYHHHGGWWALSHRTCTFVGLGTGSLQLQDGVCIHRPQLQ